MDAGGMRHGAAPDLELTILMPCLDEAETLSAKVVRGRRMK